jgi:hypothetical protein
VVILQIEDFYNLYSSPNIIRVVISRRMRWMVYVARMEQMKIAYEILVGKTAVKEPLGRTKRR